MDNRFLDCQVTPHDAHDEHANTLGEIFYFGF